MGYPILSLWKSRALPWSPVLPSSDSMLSHTVALVIPCEVASPQSLTPFHQALQNFPFAHQSKCLRKSQGMGQSPIEISREAFPFSAFKCHINALLDVSSTGGTSFESNVMRTAFQLNLLPSVPPTRSTTIPWHKRLSPYFLLFRRIKALMTFDTSAWRTCPQYQ